ncbi:MAG: SDR family oxidoreductase [Chlamydiales bacterium]
MNIQKQNEEPLPDVVLPECSVEKRLKGQKALVTGANSGIGRGVAIALGHAGADVVVNYVSHHEMAQEVVDEIKKVHPETKSYIHEANVADESEVIAMFEEMRSKLGTIDILVNNAGLQRDAPLTKMTLEQWNTVISVNLTGQFLCAREAAKEFIRRGVVKEVSCAAGKIIHISSVHEVIPWAGHVNYASSKGGVSMLMRSIAQELAQYRIRVNSICPGAIQTAINKQAWSTPEALNSLLKLIPYNRIGEPDDIGRVAVWLASDQADYITGVSLFVDGGMTLYPGFTSGG